MKGKLFVFAAILTLGLFIAKTPANAQEEPPPNTETLGVFCWNKMASSSIDATVVCCNIDLVNNVGSFALTGNEDTINGFYPTHGTAALSSGVVRMFFIQDVTPGSGFHYYTVELMNGLNGAWDNGNGESGDFSFQSPF